jgi:hypothetical protein
MPNILLSAYTSCSLDYMIAFHLLINLETSLLGESHFTPRFTSVANVKLSGLLGVKTLL